MLVPYLLLGTNKGRLTCDVPRDYSSEPFKPCSIENPVVVANQKK